MISWLKQQYKNHIIQYPSHPNSDMQELINQTNEISGFTSVSGHTSYKRLRSRHDDLFMSLLIGCNVVKLFWEDCNNNKYHQ